MINPDDFAEATPEAVARLADIAERDVDRQLLDRFAKESGIALCKWSPAVQAELSRRYRAAGWQTRIEHHEHGDVLSVWIEPPDLQGQRQPDAPR